MGSKKNIRKKGKISFSEYFKEFKEGDKVAVVLEQSLKSPTPKRMQGKTGIIKERRGRAFVVEIKDQNKLKKLLIKPIHLKKLE